MLLPYTLLLIAMLSIQLGAGLAKQLFPMAGAAGTTSLRLFFAALILILVWKPWRHKFSRAEIKNLFIYGTSLGLMNLTFYLALKRIPLGIAVALEFLGPLAVAIFSSKRTIDYLWAILAMVGIFLIFPSADLNQAIDYLGVFFAVLAGLFWAFYIIFGQRAGTDLHGGIASCMGMFFALIVALPFGLIIDGEKLLNPQILPMAVAVAILSSALPYSLEMYVLKRIPSKTFGILMSAEPAIASLVGLIFLSEALTSLQWTAILSIIIASIGSSLSR